MKKNPSGRIYLRKAKVAERYDTTVRTIERMVADGTLPKPHYFGSRFPRWREDELDAADRNALIRRSGTAA
jgi:predicted DNA-binding transcriptional regulator AlpA